MYSIAARKACEYALQLCSLFVVCGCTTETSEKDRFRKLLANDPGIENVGIEGDYEDFSQYNVYSVTFSVRGKPNSRITLFPYGDASLDALRIFQIGSIRPVMFERDPYGMTIPRLPTLGSDPRYRPPVPWKEMDLSDLVSHYDEVVEYFSKWPVKPDYSTITTDGGIEVRCFIDPPEESTAHGFFPPAGPSHEGDEEK